MMREPTPTGTRARRRWEIVVDGETLEVGEDPEPSGTSIFVNAKGAGGPVFSAMLGPSGDLLSTLFNLYKGPKAARLLRALKKAWPGPMAAAPELDLDAAAEAEAVEPQVAPVSVARSSRGRSPVSAGTLGPEHELSAEARAYRDIAEPERDLLSTIFSDQVAAMLAAAPGGWRTLSEAELVGLSEADRRAVKALQVLVQRSFPPLPRRPVTTSADLAAFYGPRLAGHTREVFIAAGLNGKSEIIASVEVAAGAPHHVSVLPRQVIAAMLRTGASAFTIIHNHPSGDPTPSSEDVALTRTIAAAGECVGLPLVDHVIVACRGRGYTSLLDLGVIADQPGEGGKR